MRKLYTHLALPAEALDQKQWDQLKKEIPVYINAMDDPDRDTKLHYHYELGVNIGDVSAKVTDIRFHNQKERQPISWKGITEEALLAVIVDRLENYSKGNEACKEAEKALPLVVKARDILIERTKRRQAEYREIWKRVEEGR